MRYACFARARPLCARAAPPGPSRAQVAALNLRQLNLTRELGAGFTEVASGRQPANQPASRPNERVGEENELGGR